MVLRAGRFTQNERICKAAENNPVMKEGEKGDAVAIVQQALVDLGFAMPITTRGGRGLADGIFGDETCGVVKQFQELNRLAADGIVGRNTLTKLDELVIAESARKELDMLAIGRRCRAVHTLKTRA